MKIERWASRSGDVSKPRKARAPLRTLLLLPCLLVGVIVHAADVSTDFTCRPSSEEPKSAVVTTKLAGVPATLRIPRLVTKAPIVLWHGFGPPANEEALMSALPLDDVPAVKVYLGLPLFGSRSPEGGVKELARRQKEDFGLQLFEPAVVGAAKELPAVIESLRAHHCIAAGERIGLFGFSAGGAAALIAAADRKVPINTVVVLNASTGLNASVDAFERAIKQAYAWTPQSRQLALDSDAVRHAQQIARGNPPTAVLILQGADDTMMTTRHATELQQALLPHYKQVHQEARLQLELEPGLAHAWADTDSLGRIRDSVSEWFNQHLQPT